MLQYMLKCHERGILKFWKTCNSKKIDYAYFIGYFIWWMIIISVINITNELRLRWFFGLSESFFPRRITFVLNTFRNVHGRPQIYEFQFVHTFRDLLAIFGGLFCKFQKLLINTPSFVKSRNCQKLVFPFTRPLPATFLRERG